MLHRYTTVARSSGDPCRRKGTAPCCFASGIVEHRVARTPRIERYQRCSSRIRSGYSRPPHLSACHVSHILRMIYASPAQNPSLFESTYKRKIYFPSYDPLSYLHFLFSCVCMVTLRRLIPILSNSDLARHVRHEDEGISIFPKGAAFGISPAPAARSGVQDPSRTGERRAERGQRVRRGLQRLHAGCRRISRLWQECVQGSSFPENV